jgi:type IV secretory pathway VirB10-like protein
MGRLTDDMTRLVGEIRATREDRGRARVEMKRAVAHLRSAFAADLAGARAAWLGAMVPVPRKGAGTPRIAAPWVEREDVPREPAEERRRLKAKRDAEERAKRDAEARVKREAEEKAKRDAKVPAKRRAGKAKPPAPDKARTVHKAGGRHRPR